MFKSITFKKVFIFYFIVIIRELEKRVFILLNLISSFYCFVFVCDLKLLQKYNNSFVADGCIKFPLCNTIDLIHDISKTIDGLKIALYCDLIHFLKSSLCAKI